MGMYIPAMKFMVSGEASSEHEFEALPLGTWAFGLSSMAQDEYCQPNENDEPFGGD